MLVIIGLIVGGVLVGQDLIRAAQMRSIMDDWSRFEAARQTFRLKYDCLPGDCLKAATFGLGSNGDGNKYIASAPLGSEPWRYWVHLANAGLIEGQYTGLTGPAHSYDAVIGINVPKSKVSGVGYMVVQRYPHATTWSNLSGIPNSMTTHFYVTGKDQNTTNNQTYGGVFSTLETSVFDQKFDDGLANNGKIRSHATAASIDVTCTTGAAPDYTYDLTLDNSACNLMYLFWP